MSNAMATPTAPATSPADAYTVVALSVEAIKNDAKEEIKVMDGGDTVRQGDVYVTILGDLLPDETGPWEGRQVAEGNTQGSRHTAEGDCQLVRVESRSASECLAKVVKQTKGQTLFFGPMIKAPNGFTLAHPEHGDRVLPPGNYITTIQKTWANEVRRAMD